MKMILIYSILLLSLFGCSTPNEKVEDSNEKPDVKEVSKQEERTYLNESNQVGDFKVAIAVDKSLHPTASITYVGDEKEKTIYHGGNIFFFNVYQQDGDFKQESAMNQPLLATTLIQNEPHTIQFNELEELEKGVYEFEAIANFSLDSEDVMGTKLEIPVSKIQVIE